jgi:signal transduction histidine kinase
MSDPRETATGWGFWRWSLTAAAVVLLLAGVNAGQLTLALRIKGQPAPLGLFLLVECVEWGLWALAVVGILRLERHLRRGGSALRGRLGVHASVALIWAVLHASLMVGLLLAIDPSWEGVPWAHGLASRLSLKLPAALGLYAAVLAVVRFTRLRREREQSALREARLEAGLAEARLRELQAQLQPHFLFNALHTVAGLVRAGRGADAVDTVTRLAALLRRAARRGERFETPFEEELDFVSDYLEIQRRRFGAGLAVAVEVAPDARRALVPSMLLQPLVENALRHGADPESGRVELSVVARREGGRLRLEVRDRGPGFGATPGAASGLGLSNTRARLEGMYGGEAALETRDTAPGACVVVTLPFRIDEIRAGGADAA